MSKRQIERALKAKGIEAEYIMFGWQPSPGEMVPGWDIKLTDDSEDRILNADGDFDDFDPDCRNTAEVLEWIETLPSLAA
jgi:hypothetical protein